MKHVCKKIVVATSLVLPACSTPEALVYSSNQVYGISLKSAPETANVPALFIGGTLSDVAFVPTTAEKDKQILRGCYRTATTGPLKQPCKPEESTLDTSLQNAAQTDLSAKKRFMKIQAVDVDGASKGSMVDQHMQDGFSVFGSFDSEAKVEAGDSQGASMALGKVFATGAAAQHIGEGYSINLRHLNRVQCLQELNKIFDLSKDKLTADEIVTAIKASCKFS